MRLEAHETQEAHPVDARGYAPTFVGAGRGAAGQGCLAAHLMVTHLHRAACAVETDPSSTLDEQRGVLAKVLMCPSPPLVGSCVAVMLAHEVASCSQSILVRRMHVREAVEAKLPLATARALGAAVIAAVLVAGAHKFVASAAEAAVALPEMRA